MKIDYTTLEIISKFGNILSKITEDKIQQNHINVYKDYIAVIQPNFIGFYNNKDRADNNEFTIDNTKIINLKRDNSFFTEYSYEYEPETDMGRIKFGPNSECITSTINKDTLDKVSILNFINTPSLCEFDIHIKNETHKPFLGDLKILKEQEQDAFLKISSDFNYIRNEKPVHPNLREDTGEIKLMEDNAVSDIVFEPEYEVLDESKFVLRDKNFIDTSKMSMIDSLNALIDEDDITKLINSGIIPNQSSLIIDDKIRSLVKKNVKAKIEEIKKLAKEEVSQYNEKIKEDKKAELNRIKEINKQLKSEYNKKKKEIELKNQTIKKDEDRLIKNYEKELEEYNQNPILSLEVSSDISKTTTFVFDKKNRAFIKDNSKIDVYIPFELLNFIPYTDIFRIKICDNFVIISYNGESKNLEGLSFLIPIYEKN